MVYCVCSNCNSNDMKLSDNEKYLICNDCGDRQFIRDLDIGFEEEKDVINIDSHWTIESCFRLYELTRLIRSKSGYKFSKTRNEEYKELHREVSKLKCQLEELNLSEINLQVIQSKASELHLKLKKLNWEMDNKM